jgi:hypothetical protein
VYVGVLGEQVIAKVGGIEIEAGQWPDLVGLLLGFAGNPAIPTGGLHAVLMAIGYLLEEIVRLFLVSALETAFPCSVVWVVFPGALKFDVGPNRPDFGVFRGWACCGQAR